MAFLDKAGLERLWAHVVSLVGTKVEKVEGKGLSTNDFTTEEKEKLANINVDEINVAIDEAKVYADSAANTVKNDLLNGAGAAYDTLKELGDLIVDNADAIEALETIASGKANSSHTHSISNITNLQSTLDAKVPTSRTINGKALSANITLSASDINAYTKTEIDALELITVADIDEICDATIYTASEVDF